ncbi:hypothetical protein H2200_008350 [Cladophialophora chaetospira]|uniref:MobA-like NTP transferase domain-containing protein n=1 Tax=Cladophialophora chaetospira TaxID=386627 RepID=A0AA38X5S8_9EURO|nr:hypothetical protein H2200_008350 [Cladophialophora chaetospira]
MAENYRIRSLILVGGRSSRMGSPKYLLNTPISPETAVPLIEKIIMVHQICQDYYRDMSRTTDVSTRDATQSKELNRLLANSMVDQTRVHYIVDRTPDAGPASGLIRAHEDDAAAHWLVSGCDYPLLEVQTLSVLIQNHLKGKKAITCFRNADGWNEPLLAIWSPVALRRLHDLGRENPAVGPNRVIREFASKQDTSDNTEQFRFGVMTITPPTQSWLRNVNTREEWEAIQPEIPDFFQSSKMERPSHSHH